MAYKRILPVGVFLLLACFAAHNCFAADLKIGVINVQKIIVSCESGKAAKERFDVKMKELQGGFKKGRRCSEGSAGRNQEEKLCLE